MRQRESYENGIFTIRFTGESLCEHGVSIYDLGTTLLSLQRLVNKAHLSIEGKLKKGAYPDKKDRERLSLMIGERRRTSDAFALLPLLSDPSTLGLATKVADYVASGIVGYYVGDVIKRISKEEDENKQQFIGSIHADVVTIVNRIDASGGVETIEIGSPLLGKPLLARFDEEKKEYINKLSGEYFLGRKRTIKGNVYRFYPNSLIATVRRSGGSKVNVFLNEKDFMQIRYHTGTDPLISFHGCPRYKFGIESQAITDFDADSIEIH